MPGDLYQPIYLTIVALMTIYQCRYYQTADSDYLSERYDERAMPSLLMAFIAALLIGLRPKAGCFVDMNNYIAFYNVVEGRIAQFNPESENFIFDNFFLWMAENRFGWPAFFLIIATIYFVGIWISCRKLFPQDTFVAFLVYLAAFSTFSYATNGVKAGAAAALFLIAAAYHERKFVAIVFLALSLGFHHSMTLPIGAFILAYFFRSIKVYMAAWCVCLLLALFHVTFFQQLLAGMTDDHGAGYLLSIGENWGGRIGFRYDFVLYSAMPVLVGYWTIVRQGIESRTYELLLSIYLIANAVWMLCMYAAFTNRIAYLSWFLYPIVLIYPFLKEDLGCNRYRQFAAVALAHLSFTIFMATIYY